MAWATLFTVLLLAGALITAGLFRQYSKRSWIGPSLVIAGCLVAGHLIPFIFFPWPILSAKGGTFGWHNILTMRTAVLIDAMQWSLVITLFACVDIEDCFYSRCGSDDFLLRGLGQARLSQNFNSDRYRSVAVVAVLTVWTGVWGFWNTMTHAPQRT